MQSKIVPNTFQTPNYLTDEIMPFLTGEQVKCYVFLCRKTFGWQKKRDRIAISQIQKATGLSHATVTKVMMELCAFHLVNVVQENDPLRNEGKEWEIELDDRKIDAGNIVKVHDQRAAVNRQRTSKARKHIGNPTPPCETDPPQSHMASPPTVAQRIQKPRLKPKDILPSKDIPMDWKIALGQRIDAVDEDRQFETQAKDIANLIDMNCSGAGGLALAFMMTRRILFTEKQIKSMRNIARELLRQKVTPEIVTEATYQLMSIKEKTTGNPYVCTTLAHIQNIAVNLANPSPAQVANPKWKARSVV